MTKLVVNCETGIVKEVELSKEDLASLPSKEELFKQELEAKLQESYAYLASTAWYIERLNDPSSGKEVPQEVLDGRANARLLINELEG